MQFEHLEHKHGGRITELTEIRHGRHDGRAYWDFVGNVEWHDGGKSRGILISPVCLCHGEAPEAREELDRALAALNDYLGAQGRWVASGWRPRAPAGRAEI